MNKIKLIYGLTAAVIVLILVSIGIDLAEKLSEKPPVVEYNVSQIEEMFLSELDNFGIEEEWIAKKKIWNNVPDSVKYYYKIKVPMELTIPEMLLLFEQKFEQYENIAVENEEYKINGTSQLQILSGGKLKFRAQFDYNKEIGRVRPNVSFVVGELENLSEQDKKKLLEISYPCALMLIPSPETKKIVESLSAFDKDYVILINDNLTGELYEMDSGSSKRKVRRSISNIVSNFSTSVKVFVDQKSDLFNSVLFNYVKDEFRKKKIVLYRLSTLKNVSEKSEEEKRSFLQYHFNDVESNEKKVFYITAEDYVNLQTYIEKYKKKGNKFVPLSKD